MKRSASPKPLRERNRVPYKTILLALLLTISAFIFFSVGSSLWLRGKFSDSVVYFLLGTLVFIPGSYHLFIYVQLVRKVPGYTYDMIPTFND